jgi:hypothetical protein
MTCQFFIVLGKIINIFKKINLLSFFMFVIIQQIVK